MKFKIRTSGHCYSLEAAKNLQALGITFEQDGNFAGEPLYKKKTQNIEIEIGSLEELMSFAEKWGELIVSHNPPEIEIYDDYRE